jgi:hypothetical protein
MVIPIVSLPAVPLNTASIRRGSSGSIEARRIA